MEKEEVKYWKEQEKKTIWLVNSIKGEFSDDPFLTINDHYSPVDARNKKYWLEKKGTTYDRAHPNFPYELQYSKILSMMKYIIDHYNRTGEKRDLLLLLQHDVDRSIDHEIFFGHPCKIHLINLTAIFNFEPLFGKYLHSDKKWHWKGKEEVNITGHAYDPDGALSIYPRPGELLWNSSGFCQVLRRRAAVKEEKSTPVPPGNGKDAPAVALSAKKNEVE